MIQRLLFSLLLLPAFASAQQVSKPAAKPAEAATSEPATAPQVTFKTSLGEFTVEVYPDKAPKTVENFLEYVNSGFYDGTVFHRVVDNFMVQGGGFSQDLKHKPTRPAIQNEGNNGLSNLRGSLAMARTMDPQSATSQFFVNVVDNPRIDYSGNQDSTTWGYCVFGKVISGMDVVDKIKALPTGALGPFPGEVPLPTPVIEKASQVKLDGAGNEQEKSETPMTGNPKSQKPKVETPSAKRPAPKKEGS